MEDCIKRHLLKRFEEILAKQCSRKNAANELLDVVETDCVGPMLTLEEKKLRERYNSGRKETLICMGKGIAHIANDIYIVADRLEKSDRDYLYEKAQQLVDIVTGELLK